MYLIRSDYMTVLTVNSLIICLAKISWDVSTMSYSHSIKLQQSDKTRLWPHWRPWKIPPLIFLMSRAQNAFGHRVAKPSVSKNKCNIAVPHRNPTNPITERQRMIGVCNHLRNERYLGSITILSFGEPGSLGHQKTTPPNVLFQIQVPSKPRFVKRPDIFEPFENAWILRVDAGQLRESDCIPTEWLSRRPQIWAS